LCRGKIFGAKVVELNTLLHKATENLKETSLFFNAETSEQLFVQKKKELEDKGVTDISNIEKFTKQIAKKMKN